MITVVAVLLVLVIGSGAPALGRQIAHGIYCTVAHMFGQDACSGGPAAPANPYEAKCFSSASTSMAQGQVSIAFVQLSDNDTLIRWNYSDGSSTFLMTHQATAALQEKLGAELELGNLTLGELETASGGLFLAGAKEWDFSTRQQAAAFQQALQGHGPLDTIVHDVVDPFNLNPITGWVLGLFGDHAGDPLPAPTATYVKGGVTGTVDLSGTLSSALRASLGYRRTTSGKDRGDSEVYLNLDLNGAVSGLLGIGGASGSAGGGYVATPGAAGAPPVLALTLSPSGKPLSATINLYIAAAAGLGLPKTGIPGMSATLKALAGGGGGIQYTGTIDLAQHPGDLAALLAATNGNFLPLEQALNNDGTQQVQPFTDKTSNITIGGQAGLGIDVGAEGQVAGTSQNYFPGWIKPPGLPWGGTQCTK